MLKKMQQLQESQNEHSSPFAPCPELEPGLVFPSAPGGPMIPSAPVLPPDVKLIDDEAIRYREAMKILSLYNFILLLDDSGSMEGERWEQMLEVVDSIASEANKYDDDGVDIHFLNYHRPFNLERGKSVLSEVQKRKIEPRGSTPIGAKLESIFKDYKKQYLDHIAAQRRGEKHALKPINIIIMTDGNPSDEAKVEGSIVSICNFFKEQKTSVTKYIGIQFFQVGNEEAAKKYLKGLDDDLKDKYKIPDIVDTVTYDPKNNLPLKAVVWKTLLGGINQEADSMSNSKKEVEKPKGFWASIFG